jgi:hypothetical protein
MEHTFSSDELRDIILNAHKIKKNNTCPDCRGTGGQNWNCETGGDVKPGYLTEYDDLRLDGECEKCDGVGYIDLLIY